MRFWYNILAYSLLPKFQIVNDKYDVNHEVMMMMMISNMRQFVWQLLQNFSACMESFWEMAFDLSASEIMDSVLKSKTSADVLSLLS